MNTLERWGVWCSGDCDRVGPDGWWHEGPGIWRTTDPVVAQAKAAHLAARKPFRYEAKLIPPVHVGLLAAIMSKRLLA